MDSLADIRQRSRVVTRAYFGDHNDGLFTLVPLDTERNHITGTYPVKRTDGTLYVFGENVAAANDDDILDAPAEHEFTSEQVSQIAGTEPAITEQRRGCVEALVVPGSNRSSPHKEFADVPLG